MCQGQTVTPPPTLCLSPPLTEQKHSHLADEYLRMILSRLNQAVTSCIEAAGHEHSPQVQKLLLRVSEKYSVDV